tara:strand:+ start:451 stop:588 length:138 start_codon:yes stop_codon:yes gene_type:complete
MKGFPLYPGRICLNKIGRPKKIYINIEIKIKSGIIRKRIIAEHEE